MATWAAPFSTPSVTSRWSRPRRSTTCRTSSSRRTPRGRAAGSSTAASSSSATTSVASRPASRCSTWSTRAPGTDPGDNPLMQIAIVGLAGSGKTTVFNTLTGGHAETGGYGGVTLNVGVVKVPDPRLDALAAIFKPKKIIQADVTYADLPAHHLARLRDSDALLHVVRAFEDPANPHPAGSVDPARDLEQLDLEFLLADLAMAERRLERLKGTGRHGTPAEREAAEREEVVLRGIHTGLEAGTPIRDLGLDADETKAIRGFRFLTEKPVLVLLNVGEGDVAREAELVAAVTAGYDHQHAMVDALSARIEMELGELEPDEAAVFMEELGIAESSLDRVIALSYKLLGLISFLTAGPDEVRAWPIRDVSTAGDAAGAIHTD